MNNVNQEVQQLAELGKSNLKNVRGCRPLKWTVIVHSILA